MRFVFCACRNAGLRWPGIKSHHQQQRLTSARSTSRLSSGSSAGRSSATTPPPRPNLSRSPVSPALPPPSQGQDKPAARVCNSIAGRNVSFRGEAGGALDDGSSDNDDVDSLVAEMDGDENVNEDSTFAGGGDLAARAQRRRRQLLSMSNRSNRLTVEECYAVRRLCRLLKVFGALDGALVLPLCRCMVEE